MAQKVTKEELLAKAKKPAEDAMKLHTFYRGKMQTVPKSRHLVAVPHLCYTFQQGELL